MTTTKTLTWNDRIAIIERFKPTDTEIKQHFGVTQNELDTARELRNTGVVVPTSDIDFSAYSPMFSMASSDHKQSKKSTVSSTTKPTTSAETASKSIKLPKKRGRQSNNIVTAFTLIPSTPTSAIQFAEDNNVSLNVLRQSRRFDVSPDLGAVHVKKDKETSQLMVWRDDV